MAKDFQAVTGMNDILPVQTPYWQFLESILRELVSSYAYSEIRFPYLEHTALFKRTVGEVTDIVEKEMYSFTDIGGDSLSLRPEGTAGCVRAGIQHGLLHNQLQRLWYLGPMFRHEKPQKGRYRQFHQFGVEAFGFAGPDVDAEQIVMMARLWQQLNIADSIQLELNSLGNFESRAKYRDELVAYFSQYQDSLDEDSQRRLHKNPLRILDSKNEKMQPLIADAPKMLDHLDDEAQAHLDGLCEYLELANIKYTINPRMVRGLDYYGKTVYEWVSDHLGAQGTVCAGGRYNRLVEMLGGKATPAVGFAMGLERVIMLLEAVFSPEANPHVYIIMMGDKAEKSGFLLAENIRRELPECRIMLNCGGGNFKKQFKRADASGAKIAVIVGEDEVQNNSFSIKYLRDKREQATHPIADVKATLLAALVE